jgi:hypothetical protein
MELPLVGWTKIDVGGPLLWRNQAGDELSQELFAVAPDLPSALDYLDPLRRLYREMLGDVGGLVEVETVAMAGRRAVQAIFKIPQSPTGMTYLAAVTLPFRDCSFVLKWQCPEQGTTGIRDTAVFSIVAPPFDEVTGQPLGFSRRLVEEPPFLGPRSP